MYIDDISKVCGFKFKFLYASTDQTGVDTAFTKSYKLENMVTGAATRTSTYYKIAVKLKLTNFIQVADRTFSITPVK